MVNRADIGVTLSVIAIIIASIGFFTVGSMGPSLGSRLDQMALETKATQEQLRQISANVDSLAKATGVPLGSPEELRKVIAEQELIAAARKEGVLRMLGQDDPPDMEERIRTFEGRYGIDVVYQQMQPDDAVARLIVEYAAGRRDWDSVKLGTDDFPPLVERNVLGRVEDPFYAKEVSEFPQQFRKPFYIVMAASPYGFVYNVNALSQSDLSGLTWENLVKDPKWRGRLGVRDPIASGSAAISLGGVYLMFNEDRAKFKQWLTDLIGQRPLINPDDGFLELAAEGGQIDAIANGVSLNVIGFNKETKGEEYPLDWNDAIHKFMFTGSVAIPSDPPHPNAAKLWFRFLISKEGVELEGKTGAVTRGDVDSPISQRLFTDPNLVIVVPEERLVEIQNIVRSVWSEVVT